MFRKFRILVRQLVLPLLLGSVALAQSGEPTTSRSMRITEFKKTAADSPQVNYFTVVGAVDVSAVYASTRTTVPLDELISAAKGLAETASGSIRVMRDGRPRSQLMYEKGIDLPVFPGEVVVVVPLEPDPLHPVEVGRIPVACLGLDQRPVVLPLIPELNSLPLLTDQLMQPREILGRTMVIHPNGRPPASPLVPGTVIYFDPAALNARDLKIARSKQEFPPTVLLEEALLPTVTPAAPSDSAPGSRRTTALPTPILEVSTAGQLATPASSSQSESALAPPGSEEPELPVPLIDSFSTGPGQFLAPPTINNVEAPFVGELRTIPTSTGSAPPLAERTSWVYSKDSAATAEVASRHPISDEPQPTLADVSLAPEPDFAPSDTSAEETTTIPAGPKNSGSIRPIAIGVGLLTILCFGISLVWSRWERMAPTAMQSLPLATASKPVPPVLRSTLDQLLDPQSPVIEEQVHQAAPATLFGEAQGTRHLQVHGQHASLAGPHFSKVTVSRPRQTVNAQQERDLRSALRKAVASRQVSGPGLSGPSSQPVEPADVRVNVPEAKPAMAEPKATRKQQFRYDVVQPEAEGIIASQKIGPLERALRSRTGEQRG